MDTEARARLRLVDLTDRETWRLEAVPPCTCLPLGSCPFHEAQQSVHPSVHEAVGPHKGPTLSWLARLSSRYGWGLYRSGGAVAVLRYGYGDQLEEGGEVDLVYLWPRHPDMCVDLALAGTAEVAAKVPFPARLRSARLGDS